MFPGGSDSRESAGNAGDPGLIPGLGRSPGGGHSSILAWKIPRDRGAWWDTAHRVTKSWTRLSRFHFHTVQIFLFCVNCSHSDLYVYSPKSN